MFIAKTDYTLNRKKKTLLFVKLPLVTMYCLNGRILPVMKNLRNGKPGQMKIIILRKILHAEPAAKM